MIKPTIILALLLIAQVNLFADSQKFSFEKLNEKIAIKNSDKLKEGKNNKRRISAASRKANVEIAENLKRAKVAKESLQYFYSENFLTPNVKNEIRRKINFSSENSMWLGCRGGQET